MLRPYLRATPDERPQPNSAVDRLESIAASRIRPLDPKVKRRPPTVPDERNVFLLSLKAGGSGLKCTFAVMFLLVVNILGHNRKLGFGNGGATVTCLP